MDKTMVRFATFLAVLLAFSNASAGPISWVNWTSMTTGVPGSAPDRHIGRSMHERRG